MISRIHVSLEHPGVGLTTEAQRHREEEGLNHSALFEFPSVFLACKVSEEFFRRKNSS
jgi:hypothetical protein